MRPRPCREGGLLTGRRKKPGPATGTTYRSAEETKRLLIDSVERLLDEGVPVARITARAVTEAAGVDKMYVSRFFGGLHHLLLAVIEDLLAVRMKSMISSDVFVPGGDGRVDRPVEQAFALYVHLAGDDVLHPELRTLASVVVNVYAEQMRREFNLTPAESEREAMVGLVWIVGYLQVGHLLPVEPTAVAQWMSLRRGELRRRNT